MRDYENGENGMQSEKGKIANNYMNFSCQSRICQYRGEDDSYVVTSINTTV